MCDTLYRSFSPHSAFFGKNSDRVPSEAQTLCIVLEKSLAYVLSKPSWMKGGEMGINQAGVAIGNEAVFSRWKPAKNGVLGMDILRKALASSSTAKDAVDYICSFVESNDQGGNGSYKGSLYYDNSFLVSDSKGAFIVETAGRRWAWRSALAADAISNCYCIEEDYKRLDTQTRKEISPVNESAACSDEADPGRKGHKESFKEHVENRFYLRFSKAEVRRACSLSLLADLSKKPAALAPRARILDILDTLRSHGNFDPRSRFKKNMESLCIHEGILPPVSATTASMAVEYKGGDAAIIWFSGTSYPCISLYKPILLVEGRFIPLWTDYDYTEGNQSAIEYWEAWRSWVGKEKAHAKSLDPGFAEARNHAQETLAMIAERALADLLSHQDGVSTKVLAQEARAVVAGWEKDLRL